MHPTETHIFVSYSRTDQGLVTPIVQMLRATGAAVFRDLDSLPPGKKWRLVIEESIDHCCVLLVFWCSHARASPEVRKEWERAIQEGKDVIPVLLDDTPLEPALAEYQAIDFRRLVAAHSVPPSGRHLLAGAIELWELQHLNATQQKHLQDLEFSPAQAAVLDLLLEIKARGR